MHFLQPTPRGLAQDRNGDEFVESDLLLQVITMLETQLLDELKESTKKCSQGLRQRTLRFHIVPVYLDPHVVIATTVSCVTEAVSATGSSAELLIPVC